MDTKSNQMKKKELISKILDYVFDSEMENFAENPSKDHVYYLAILLESGEKEANAVLEEAITDLNNIEGE